MGVSLNHPTLWPPLYEWRQRKKNQCTIDNLVVGKLILINNQCTVDRLVVGKLILFFLLLKPIGGSI